MVKQPNIVQAEFFHVGGKNTPSLEALFEECGERVADGLELVFQGVEARSRIKTVVRFYDEGNIVTDIVVRLSELEQQSKKLFDAVVGSTGWRQRIQDIRYRRLSRKINKVKGASNTLAVQQLGVAIRTAQQVAVERNDHSFRLAREDEMHELLEAASRARGVWLFVFKPNDLLSDTNASVAYAM